VSVLVALPEALYARDAFAAFDPAVSFSGGNARAMAWAAQLAYEDDDRAKAQRILGGWGFARAAFLAADVVSVLPVASTRVLVVSNADALLVAFKGTDPLVLATWITDLAALPKRPDIHGGFSAALEAVWDELRTVLTNEGRGKRVFVTGHSLGGALAVLAARRARDELGLTVAAVYAFGMPRAGDAAFGTSYDALTNVSYRFVYGDDFVAQVPPSHWGFRHVGRRFSCARGDEFDTSSPGVAPIDDEPAFVAHLGGNLLSLFNLPAAGVLLGAARTDSVGRLIELLPPPLRDHIPDRYWGAL